jgi:hypothetical protein
MATPRVDLSRINPLVEIMVRAGDAKSPQARKNVQAAYLKRDFANFPDAPGISVLFRPGATLDELAREGAFPHNRISFSVIGKIIEELAAVGYELVLFVTPTPALGLPDHHSLAVERAGVVEPSLPDAAADALLGALTVVDNPYRPQRP